MSSGCRSTPVLAYGTPYTRPAPEDLSHSQTREFVSRAERDPLGMRVADPLVQHIGCLACMKEEFAMELTVPMLSEQDRHVQRWDPRQYV